MSFVTTLPEAMTHAAGQLAGIGEALAAENGSVLTPTTIIAPAGTDPVSQLQASVFATYGSLYQSISQQAQAVHQQLVQTLGQNAGAYAAAEETNQSATSLGDAIQGFLTNIVGMPTSGSSSVLSGNAANIGNIGTGNWASAGSALLGLAGGGLLDFPEEVAADAGVGLVGFDQAAGAGAPGVLAGVGGAPVAAGAGQASTVGAMSVPPSWAGEGATATAAAPARLAPTSIVAAQPGLGMTAVPAAMPMAAAAAGGGARKFGAPRYGVKHTVAPKSTAV